MPEVTAELTRVGTVAFSARAGSGGEVVLDGSPDLGGTGQGMRPMELLLSGLAGCAAIDVVHILSRQRQSLTDLRVQVRGHRPDQSPAPFTRVHLVFEAEGEVAPSKLERAVRLAVEKYCSVRLTLGDAVSVTWEARLAPGQAPA